MQSLNDNKRGIFLKNFANLVFIKITSKFLPLLITGHLIKTIGLFEFGRLGFAKAIAFYFTTLISYGFDYTGSKKIMQANFAGNKKTINNVISNIFSTQVLTILFCCVCFIYLPDFSSNIRAIRQELKYFFFLSIVSSLYPIYAFHGLNRTWIISILSVFSKILTLILTYYFIKSPNDKFLVILIQAYVDLARMLIAYCILIFKYDIRFHFVKIRNIFQQYKDSFSFFIYNCYLLFGSKFSMIYLGFIFKDPVMLGIFSLSNQLLDFAKGIYNVAIQTLYPILSAQMGKNSNVYTFIFKYLIGTIIPIILIFTGLTYCLAPSIMKLFTTENVNLSIKLLRMLTLIFPVISINEFLGTNIMIPTKRSYVFVIMMVVCVFLSVIFHIYFVGIYGMFGATYAIFSQELALLLLQIVFLMYCKF